MADYYPLIARAVSGLPSSTLEGRRAIYERARNALIGQLRKLDPPIPESDVARESAALEKAIARLEAELTAPVAQADPPEATAEAAREPEPLVGDAAAVEATPPPQGQASEPPPHSVAPVVETVPHERVAPDQEDGGLVAAPPSPAARPASPPAFFKLRRHKAAEAPATQALKAGQSRPSFRSPLFPPPPEPAKSGDAGASAPAAAASASLDAAGAADDAPANAAAFAPNDDDFASRGDAMAARPAEPDRTWAAFPEPEPPDGAAGGESFGDAEDDATARRISPILARPRPDAQRPSAPQPARDDGAPRRLWLVGFVVGIVVLLVAIAAFQLRDRPDDLRQKAAAPVVAPEPGPNGKIVDRIGVGSERQQSAAKPSADAGAAVADQAAAAAPRAALLVEAPDEPSKVKTYVGSVVWRIDNVSTGPGDPLTMAVRADVSIPDEKLQTVVILQKNLDGGLPASHTMKIQFIEGPDSQFGSVQKINAPQMRREDTPTGDALSGALVPITDNSFLFGLSRGPSEASNLDLLKTRDWVDVPMLLSNGRIAKLTFEKGAAGERAMADALADWKVQ